MPKRQPGYERKSQPQLVVRIPEQLDETLRQIVDLLGIDTSGLVRMILTEHAAEYVERGLAARDRLRAAKAKLSVPSKAAAPRWEPFQKDLDLPDVPIRPAQDQGVTPPEGSKRNPDLPDEATSDTV